MSNNKLFILGFLLFSSLILTGAGCKSGPPSSSDSNLGVEIKEDAVGFWQKYKNYDVGFEILYPYNFEVKENFSLSKIGMSSGFSFVYPDKRSSIGVWREDYENDAKCFGQSPEVYKSNSTKFYKTEAGSNVVYATKKDFYCYKVGFQNDTLVKEGSTDEPKRLFKKILDTFFVSPAKFPPYSNSKITLPYPPLLVDFTEGKEGNMVVFDSIKGSGLKGYPELEKPPYTIELNINKYPYDPAKANLKMLNKKWVEIDEFDGGYNVIHITGQMGSDAYTFSVRSKSWPKFDSIPTDEIGKEVRTVVTNMLLNIKPI